MRRFLLTGASGQLGSAWLRWLSSQEDVEIISVGRTPPAGTLERNTVHRSLVGAEELASWKPYAVLHLAGPSRPERAAEDPDQARLEAVRLTEALGAAARLSRAKMVLISCDRVFDGGTGPFPEEASPVPASALGLALRACEEAVEAATDDRLIIRTSALFGWSPSRTDTLLSRWVRKWDSGGIVHAAAEVQACPTWIDALPRIVHALYGRDGLFHIGGPQRMSLYDLARLTARTWDEEPDRVRSSDTDRFEGGLISERYQAFAPRLPAMADCLPDIRRQLEVEKAIRKGE